MIEQQFQFLGFNSNEANVYLALAEVGKSTAQALAKRLGIARTTAYSVLDNLVAKGLVTLEKKQNTTFYAANNPDVLQRLVQKEKQEIQAKENVAEQLVKLIGPYFKSKNFSVPKLQFFESQESVEQMLYDFSPIWQDSIFRYDGVWWGYQDHSFVEQYLPWLEWHWERFREGEKVKLFSNQAKIEEELRGRDLPREIRPIPSGFNFTSSIWVLGEHIVMIMTAQQPHYAFQVTDAVFAANLRAIFQLMWDVIE